MKKGYKVRKVFDCQDMPDDIRRMFFDIAEKGNDCVVEWTVAESDWPANEWGTKYKAIDTWLVDNGADGPKGPGHSGETVLIRHWW